MPFIGILKPEYRREPITDLIAKICKILVLTLGVVGFVVSTHQIIFAQTPYTFTTADPDDDTVKYEIQITGADDSSYADPIIDFISDLGTPGDTYFTLSQTATLGDTYVRGSSATTLAPGTYIWRVKAFDMHNASSNYTDTVTFTVTDLPPPPIVIDPPVINPPPVVVDPPVVEPPVTQPPITELPTGEEPSVIDTFALESTITPTESLLPALFEHRERTPIDGTVASITTIGTFGSMILAPVTGSLIAFFANASSMLVTQAGATSLLNTLVVSSTLPVQSSAMGGFAQLVFQPMRVFFLGLIPRRKKKPWGTVKSALSGLGIERALVRLIAVEFDRTVKQTITDRTGAYAFTIGKAGGYRVGVTIIGYDQYLSDPFHVTNIDDVQSNLNVALSPAHGSMASSHFAHMRILAIVQKVFNVIRMPLLVVGTVINIYDVVVIGDRLSWILMGLYCLFWIFEYIIRHQARPYGTITDSISHKRLSRVLVRILSLENEHEKLVGTVVTGDDGRYQFLLAPGRYIITATLFGYTAYRSEILTFAHKTQPHNAIKLTRQNKPLTNVQTHDTVKMKEE